MKILVGYDGTHVAREALELAKEHAMLLGAKVEVVNCMAQNRDLQYEDIRKVEQNLEGEVHAILNSEKIPYKTHLLISSQESGKALVHYAEQNKID